MLVPALPADAAAVLQLRDAASDWLIARGVDQWRRGDVAEATLAACVAAGELFVVRRGDGIAAAVIVRYADEPIWGRDDGRAGYVHTLVIDRAHAGTGLGRRVLAAAETIIAATGRPLARLDCVAHNPGLIAYYRQAGYTRVGQVDTRREPAALFEKRLGRTSAAEPGSLARAGSRLADGWCGQSADSEPRH